MRYGQLKNLKIPQITDLGIISFTAKKSISYASSDFVMNCKNNGGKILNKNVVHKIFVQWLVPEICIVFSEPPISTKSEHGFERIKHKNWNKK